MSQDFSIIIKHELTPEQHEKTPDGDYTDEFLEAGTTFTPTGAMTSSQPIPVEKAWVKNGFLHMQGRATWAGPA